MNKITREHFPVSKLPEELQEEFAQFETVTVVGEPRGEVARAQSTSTYSHYDELMATIKPMSLTELLADREAHPERYSGNVTPDEAVARVRVVRDEWDSDR